MKYRKNWLGITLVPIIFFKKIVHGFYVHQLLGYKFGILLSFENQYYQAKIWVPLYRCNLRKCANTYTHKSIQNAQQLTHILPGTQ